MAATTMTSNPPNEPRSSLPLPARQPLPLSASQESQVRELYHKRVRNKCADEVRGIHALPFSLRLLANEI